MFLAFEREVKNDLIKKKINNDERFSISLDEWTSTRNKKYLCLNLHTVDDSIVHSLGMIRLEGSIKSQTLKHHQKQTRRI
ncbi:hypothetical protein A3Q56_00478 [Intoshia linei]|uniref:Uncharacterized protein n=1 Tax=Intoshia linei TaxID=1819745 RepID=A0A177BDU9_9BILA|nr:hypothetical protein A3Q56_00478 [Intoshia linei]